ncbi:MAG: hypothetical protein ACYS5V_15525 [Planctomycetota bacterium]|jgi:hypothetical protein
MLAVCSVPGSGQGAHRLAKLLMLGVIAGDLLGGLVFMVAGGMYYARAVQQPLEWPAMAWTSPIWVDLPGGR